MVVLQESGRNQQQSPSSHGKSCRGELQILQGLGNSHLQDMARVAEENSRSFKDLATVTFKTWQELPRRTPDPSRTWQQSLSRHGKSCRGELQILQGLGNSHLQDMTRVAEENSRSFKDLATVTFKTWQELPRRTPDPSRTWQQSPSRHGKSCRGEFQILQGLSNSHLQDMARVAEENSRSFKDLATVTFKTWQELPRRTPDPSRTWQQSPSRHGKSCGGELQILQGLGNSHLQDMARVAEENSRSFKDLATVTFKTWQELPRRIPDPSRT